MDSEEPWQHRPVKHLAELLTEDRFLRLQPLKDIEEEMLRFVVVDLHFAPLLFWLLRQGDLIFTNNNWCLFR